jgi:type VI protein secretion system component VasF
MGFEGRYKLLGREKLESLIRAVASELTHGSEWKMENLSPAWRRPDDFPEVVGEGVPVWATIAGVLGIALIMVVIFAAVSGHDAGEVARHIQESFLKTASR